MAGPSRTELRRALAARHTRLREALTAGARGKALQRGERHQFRSRLDAAAQVARLAWVSDAFLAQALYRVKARLQRRGGAGAARGAGPPPPGVGAGGLGG